MTVGTLKDWLKVNNQLVSGNKPELVERCVDGEVNGRIPKCPRCLLGRLKFNTSTAMYECAGYHDEDSQRFIACKNKMEQVSRDTWLDPEVDSPEEKTSSTSNATSTTTTPSEAEVPEEVLTNIKACAGAKEAADLLAKYCKNDLKLSLPQDDTKSRVTVGALLMSNRFTDENGKQQFDVKKVVASLIQSYPVPIVKPSSGRSVCEENESIAQLFDELALLYKKKGGDHVQYKISSAKKAALIIRGLNFIITDGLSLGKPGKNNKNKQEGIGMGTAKIIQEFLDADKKSSKTLETLKEATAE
jgi:hypothetical protein